MDYVLAIFLIGLAILAHEYGHFLGAKLGAVPVERFSIGFGPKLWSIQIRNTEYRVSLIPVGGYVLPEVKDETQFFELPVYKRIILAAGGPGASLTLTIICFSLYNALTAGLNLSDLLLKPFFQTGKITLVMFRDLLQSFGQPANLSSAIGLIAQGGRFIGSNPLNWLKFTALISLNLGIVNLIPLPVLDGGKILLYILEMIHPKMVKLHYPLTIAGWILILGLTIYVTVVHIGRLLY